MLRIREAEAADVPLVRRLIGELAEYERAAPGEVVATEENLLRDGFGAEPLWRALIAEWDGAPAGFAFYFFQYSTWQGAKVLYLEDLFVRPADRGRGIGKALLVELARTAVRTRCARFVWQVLDWNEPALRFYESLGARHVKEWLTMRVDGEALRKLAGA